MQHTNLTATESEQLDKAVEREGKRTQSWDDTIAKWRGTAAQSEKGYRLSIYDYINDIAVRDLIQKTLDTLTDELKRKVQPTVNEVDTIFMEATNEVAEPLVHKMLELKPDASIKKEPGWWWRRVPKLLEGEFKSDVEEWYQ